MEKKEFKVGEEFQCGLVKLKCVKQEKGLGCSSCFFDNFSSCFSLTPLTGECDKRVREDKTDVIFVKVEE